MSNWLDENIDFLSKPFEFELINGGRSNLSYLITDSKSNKVVLRRPPVSHVLSSAHDMHREYTMILALKNTGVEVPNPYCYVDDIEITGAPFYVMSFEDGLILRSVADVQQHFPGELQRKQLSENLIISLAKLHGVDYAAAGLGEFKRNENYVDRLLERWMGQFDKTKGDDSSVNDAVISTYEKLKNNNPNNPENTIIHGDYRLDNVVVTKEGKVQAILDWELSTIGDPMSDLGLSLVYWGNRELDSPLNLPAPTTLDGFMKPNELLEFYSAQSGRSVEHIDYYVSLGYWKLACILQGVHKRYSSGARAGDSSGVEGFQQLILTLAVSAQKVLGD